MESKIKGNNYIVLRDGTRFPVKLNKKKTDKALKEISDALNFVNAKLKELYDGNYDLYELLATPFEDVDLEIEDGQSWKLNSITNDFRRIQETLATHNDEISDKEEVMTLADYGFHNSYDNRLWERLFSEEGDVEVIEEIQLQCNPPLHRYRTTIWEKTDYGRSSKSITYKNVRTTKKLQKAIENTKKEYKL